MNWLTTNVVRVPALFFRVALASVVWLSVATPAGALDGTEILKATGVQGGLVVHVGCDDGRLTVQLRPNDRYLVHGLDTDPADVQKARSYVRSLGLYGPVSVEVFDGRTLPYQDNLVNLLVVSEPGQVPWSELMRVLRPGGVAYVKKDGRWTRTVKPWPKDIDQWTHFLHDASGNAVAKDRQVGPPRHVQWAAGPKHTRDHDALASLSALTTSNGRLFYIFDEGPTSLIHRPPRWKLIARDAFNGVLLWKRDIPNWVTHLYYFRSGPVHLARRLVSVGDRVYVTLGLEAPVSELDAATGKTLRVYEGSAGAEELVYHKGTLLVVVNEPEIFNDEAPKVYGYWELTVRRKPNFRKSLIAYDAGTGRVLWKKTGPSLAYLVPLSLCAHNDRVYFLDNKELHCLDLASGREHWRSPFPTEGLFLRNYAPTVVATDDVLLCLTWKRLCAFSVSDGRKLWEHKGAIGFASPGDLFVIDGLVWTVPITTAIWHGNRVGPDGKIRTGIPVPPSTFLGNGGKEIWGLDLHTGQVKRRLPRNQLLPGGHHHRCYRNKATTRYLVCGRRGVEFVDLQGQNHVNNWWIRGICQYGVLPANGLLYVPPDPCQCFNLIKLNGFYALRSDSASQPDPAAPSRPGSDAGGSATTDEAAARAGLAAKTVSARPAAATRRAVSTRPFDPPWQPPLYGPDPEDWPTFRGNVTRSGSSPTRVPADPRPLWQRRLGGRLSAPVVADGRLYVCRKDANTVHCLDAQTGQPLWDFVADGPVDSPPTIADGRCVFGCRDGSVYCLSADTGRLEWRFRVAPVDRRIVADNRLESVWPVHGAVLVQDGTVYFAAGRSSFLDGGIHVFALDLRSGRKRHETCVVTEPQRPGAKQRSRPPTGALPDVLVSDGRRINMRRVQFDLELLPLSGAPFRTLFSTTGLLEDAWFHRQNWRLGLPVSGRRAGRTASGRRSRQSPPSGQLIVFDDRAAFSAQNPYGWLKTTPSLYPPSHEGHFHQKYARYTARYFPVGVRIRAWPGQPPAANRSPRKGDSADARVAAQKASADNSDKTTQPFSWVRDVPLQVRAMVLAGDKLFLAGWKDSVAIQERTGRPLDPENPDPRPSVLQAWSARDGSTLAELSLDAEPVFDGLIAAHGRLYLTLQDGTVRCFGK